MGNQFSNTSTPVYIGVAIWGEKYCDDFMKYCLASLLAEGNIPAIDNPNGQNRFLFCTTQEDWSRLQKHPNFLLLSRYIKPVLLPLNLLSEEEYAKQNRALAYKFYMVTDAHKTLVSTMHQKKCIGGLLFPDTIFANGSLMSALRLMGDKKAVLAHFPRFATDQFMESLEARKLINLGTPTDIEGRQLIRLAMEHINMEVLAQRWDVPYGFDIATDNWWPLQGKRGMLFHSLAWCPVFINYSKLEHHDTACLENNTIDGAYLYKNLSIDDCHVITDSDDYVMISYSPQTKLKTKRISSIRKLSALEHYKINHWKILLELGFGGFVDPFKLELLKYPVYLHTEDLTLRDWKLKNKSRGLIDRILEGSDIQKSGLLTINKPQYIEKVYSTKSNEAILSMIKKNKLQRFGVLAFFFLLLRGCGLYELVYKLSENPRFK